MKSIAIFVAASLLLEMLAPTLAHATQHSQGTQVEGDTRTETAEKAEEVADQVMQWFYEKDVRVMSRGEINPSKLREGWYAYVVYTSKGVKEAVTGDIFSKDADGIVIKSRYRPWERWEIAYGDIDTLAVAKTQRDMERWRRRYEEGLIVMSRGELDLFKLRKGWYAHVVYTSEGAKRTVTGEIIDKDADGIVIKSRAKSWNRWEIAYGDIDTLVVAKARRDIEGWRRWFGERGLRARLGGELDLSRLSAILPLLEGQRIRIHTRDTEKRIDGGFHQATKDTLVLMKLRGILKQKMQFVPIAATNISKLEVHRYYKSYVKHGAIIGALAGIPFPFILLSLSNRDPGPFAGLIVLGIPMFMFMGSLGGMVVGGVFSHDVWDVIDLPPSSLRGTQTKPDRWVKVPPQRLNLSISPTPTRGLRAALSFNF